MKVTMALGSVHDPGATELRLTKHGERRLVERGISGDQVKEAIRTAKQGAQITTTIGKYRTPVKIYKGTNGITDREETAGRNAGRIITAYYF